MNSRLALGIGATLVALGLPTLVVGACGGRSELRAPWGEGRTDEDGGTEDASVDAPPDVPVDVLPDVPADVPEDVPEDAPNPCTPDVTYVYVVTSEERLFAFKPQSNSFELRGVIDCPGATTTPFSMAVSREGVAHVVFLDGTLWRVSVFDASCEATPFVPGQLGFVQFGMGYAANQGDPGETLYVAEINWSGPPMGLGRIDTDTYELSFVGPFSQSYGEALELTPTGAGPLYGYWLNFGGNGGTLTQIDTATAQIVDATPLTVGDNSSALAVAWWGSRFYIFHTPASGGTMVTRYDPSDQSLVDVASHNQEVVGAGVSTCAPASPEP